MENVADDEGLENIQLKVSVGSTYSHGDLVAEDLSANHGHSFALGGVHFTWHDGAAGLILGKGELTEATARSRTKETDIIGDLEKGGGNGVESAMEVDKGVLARKRLKLVGSGLEVVTSLLFKVLSNLFGEANIGVKACADGSASLSNLKDVLKSLLDPLESIFELSNIATELLTKGQRSGILSVGTADLDDVLELLTLLVERADEVLQAGDQALIDLENGCHVHHCGEAVI